MTSSQAAAGVSSSIRSESRSSAVSAPAAAAGSAATARLVLGLQCCSGNGDDDLPDFLAQRQKRSQAEELLSFSRHNSLTMQQELGRDSSFSWAA